MKKNIYVKPGMVMVNLQHHQIICQSMNDTLQSEEVDYAWTKESSGDSDGGGSSIWDNEW